VEPLTGDDPVQIAGYRLRARLGSGGMGRVYLALTPAGRPVALKVVRPELGDDAEFRRRFWQEVNAARRVHGLYTAQLVDADPEGTPPWLATAYVPGPSLQEMVATHGPMPEQAVFTLLAGVAEALAAIHAAGIVHRDLKPSNVLIAPDGPRVIDFGIARAADATALTGTGMLIGSAPFMAPEQVKGQAVTQAVDVFALGAVAAFAATGRSAFGEGASMAILYRVMHQEPDLAGCPPRLREVIGRCLAKDPAGRPSPAQIIADCQARTAAEGIVPAWLPPDVLAALAPDAAPLASPSPPSMPLQASPMIQSSCGKQAPWGPPMTHAGTTPGMWPAANGSVATQGVTPPPPAQGDGLLFQGGAVPGGPGTAYPPTRRPPARRPAILGGGLAVVAAVVLAVVALLTLPGHGGNPQAAETQSGTSHPAAVVWQTTLGRRSASTHATSPNVSYAVDRCIVGSWKDAGDVLVNTENDGEKVTFTGTGGSMVVHADGSATQQLGPETLTGTDSAGNVWSEVITGSATFRLTTSGGKIQFSHISLMPDAVYKLYENGVFNATGPLTISTVRQPYTCSSSTWRMTEPNSTSVYDREG
jgi:serine/threonine protein kinase